MAIASTSFVRYAWIPRKGGVRKRRASAPSGADESRPGACLACGSGGLRSPDVRCGSPCRHRRKRRSVAFQVYAAALSCSSRRSPSERSRRGPRPWACPARIGPVAGSCRRPPGRCLSARENSPAVYRSDKRNRRPRSIRRGGRAKCTTAKPGHLRFNHFVRNLLLSRSLCRTCVPPRVFDARNLSAAGECGHDTQKPPGTQCDAIGGPICNTRCTWTPSVRVHR